MALPTPGSHDANARLFRALLPGQPGGLIDFLPVLRFAGQPISPRLEESAECSRCQVGYGRVPAESSAPAIVPSGELADTPTWEWHTRFLWTGVIIVTKEVVGNLSDGLRINWHLKEGYFTGPEYEGTVLPGATDYMRIRPDGIGIVDVNEILQTRSGARLYCTYGGVFDLGPDGYARALRGELDPTPPFVGTPTYVTGDQEFAWLNRAQCIGVGRVTMEAMRLEYDVYAVSVGGRRPAE
jgi:hypothetical protein